MKFCPECGAAVSGGKFCSECGHRLQDNAVPSVGTATPPLAGIGFDLPDLGGFDALGTMANNCVAQDLAQQEAEALAPFEVEKHQNGKYAILELKDKSEMDIVVPNGVEAIGPNAFEGCDVMSVTLPEGLRKIGARAFADCEDLEEINFPKSLRVIGDEAFAGCVNLDVEPPEGVRIGEDAFPDTDDDEEEYEDAYCPLCGAKLLIDETVVESCIVICPECGSEHAVSFGEDECEEDDDDEDSGSSDRVQYLLDKVSGMMATAEALLDDDEDAEDIWEEQLESWYQMGRDYFFGENGIEEDKTEAVKWFRKAAEQGHGFAQYFMGACYMNGMGVEENKAESKKWHRKAAASGIPASRNVLRNMGWE